jgi:diguanylate cyclase (GGDEF)-like protein
LPEGLNFGAAVSMAGDDRRQAAFPMTGALGSTLHDGAPNLVIADDNADLRALVRLQFESRGWEVREAASGESALESCLLRPPDLVLLDVQMPGTDGWAVLSQLKADPELAHVPVIMLTAQDDTNDVVRGLGHGAHDYMAKPFSPRELWARADAALRTKRLQDELRRHNEELGVASHTDSLTGLPNRRLVEEQLASLSNASRRRGDPLAVVMMDIDNFKPINDAFGHSAGDAVLREVAGRLRAMLRTVDMVGRWGGDEFVLVLGGTTLDGARIVAERARASVSTVPVDLADAGPRHVTLSAGCAAGFAGTELIEAADRALLDAKRAGRDRVQAAREPVGAAAPEG